MIYFDPYLLRAFLTVAEIGTVNGTAAALGRTQAAVSMQIRKLEGLVGTRLFERSSKGLTITADGQLLTAYAREILSLNEEIGKRLQNSQIEGRVRLGVVEDFAATRLIHILKAFRDQNPKVDIDIIVEPNKRLAAMFENQKLDVVVCDVSQVNRKPMLVWGEELLWVVRSDIAVSAGTSLPIIMFEESCPWRTAAMAALADRDIQWKIVCEASTLVAMVTAVRVGIGIGPMICDTIPEDCRILDRAAGLPVPVRIDVGLYAQSAASAEADYLARFIARYSRRGLA
ncbi:LysR substrate-binding domain-containing protein [Labrys monachus]|uniref:DNA-binding transcriptional LysR family regulator n=1 Tax=Labrys monachus TaxID=217067 RepID=A0ABU0FAG5_9HYPH|nr:LysR substrate-binding domain-containing protein [Labrys monachus]MDQ0391616.1 DNA-binding transcriptional LysR family regulator [Labrys monachus]